MNQLILNPQVSFREKNGCYVFYLNFNYIFLKEVAGQLMSKVLAWLKVEDNICPDVPESFMEYLLEKSILSKAFRSAICGLG